MMYLDVAKPINGASIAVANRIVSRWRNVPNGGYRGGQTVRDLTKRHNATLSEWPTTIQSAWRGPSGRPGGHGALLFNGAGGGRCTAGSGWFPTGDFSIAFWFKTTAIDVYQGIVSVWTSDSNTTDIFVDNTGGRLFGGGGYPGSCAFTQTNSIEANRWFHIVFTSANGGATTFYLNGHLTGTTGTTQFATRTPDIALGCRVGTGSTTWTFGGWLDDIVIFDGLLNSGEAAAFYKDAQRQHPKTLNWLERPSQFEVNPAAATPTFLSPESRRLLWWPHLRM